YQAEDGIRAFHVTGVQPCALPISCRTQYDGRQQLGIIVLQPGVDAEAGAQGRRQQPRTRGGSDQGKRVEGQLNRPCIRAGLDHDVDLKILHSRVQVLFHEWAEAVYLVDKKDVTFVQVGQ